MISHRLMRTGLAAALVLAAGVSACNQGSGGGGNAAATPKEREEARADSVADEQKALRDSGVTVDTQVIDTGNAATTQPATEDN